MLASLGAGALKGAKVGGVKSEAKGSASGNVSVGGFNVTPYAGGGTWQKAAMVGGALLVIAVLGLAFIKK